MTLNKSLKDKLKAIYDAPAPMRKDAFLKQYHRREISMLKFIKIQASYVSKLSWVGSLLIFALAITFACYVSDDTTWAIASLMPAFSVLLLTENGRSIYYDMAELELASRFSLCVVGIARLAAIGMVQVVLFLLLIPAFDFFEIGTVIQGATYLLVPYLASVSLGLIVSRKLSGKNSIYGCIGAALFVEILQYCTYIIQPTIYAPQNQHLWGILLISAIIITVWQLRITVRGMEELKWNWSPAT